MAPIRTIQRSAGSQSGVRSSRMNAHTPVAASIAVSTMRGGAKSLPRHNSATEMPTSAATAGANATV
jgi:hypothetical protein